MDTVMFAPGSARNPTARWSKCVRDFYSKNGLDVKSHDFRVSQVTRYYKSTKDIIKTQEFVGHSNVSVTRGYVKMAEREVLEASAKFLMQPVANKRARA